LDELRAIREPAARAVAAKAYIEQREQAIKEARQIRDDAVRAYSKTHSISETANMCGVSQATVKVIRR
jgi:DNA invertase Pin-like site-specific DNA recombinase